MQEKVVRWLVFLSMLNALREYHTLIKDSLTGREKQVVNNAMKSLNAVFKQYDKDNHTDEGIGAQMLEVFLAAAEELEKEILKPN